MFAVPKSNLIKTEWALESKWNIHFEKVCTNNNRNFAWLAIFLYPAFFIVDYFLVPDLSALFGFIRLCGSFIISIALYLSYKNKLGHITLGYITLISIVCSVDYVCSKVGKDYLMLYNLNFCVFYITASFLTVWAWQHSLLIALVDIVMYLFFDFYSGYTFSTNVIQGGLIVCIVQAFYIVFTALRNKKLKNEFMLKY